MADLLEEAIEIWKDKARDGLNKEYPPCPLCSLQKLDESTNIMICGACPVSKAGHSGCVNTPYWDAHQACMAMDDPLFKYHAQREVGFLEGLR